MNSSPPPLPDLRNRFLPPRISPSSPFSIKEALIKTKARLIFLETLECRIKMSKEKITEERKIATEKFKFLIKLLAE